MSMVEVISKILLVQIAVCAVLIHGQTTCTTPQGKGVCTPPKNCPFIMELINQNIKQSPAQIRNMLRQYQCPEANKACCPLLPGRQTCGLFEEDKIFGGERVAISHFPWTALIEYLNPTTGRKVYQCAGSLINSRYVLTAAHCLHPKLLGNTRVSGVRFGETNLKSDIDCENNKCNDRPLDVSIQQSILHPGFNPAVPGAEHDIALIRLRRPVTYTEFIKPVCLASTREELEDDYNNRWPTVTGWGTTEDNKRSDWKLKTELPIVLNNECRGLLKNIQVKNTQICAGGTGTTDTCSGDSGGSLVLKNSRNNWLAIGIISAGSRFCAQKGIPSIFVKVNSYMDWINQNIAP